MHYTTAQQPIYAPKTHFLLHTGFHIELFYREISITFTIKKRGHVDTDRAHCK